MTRIFFAALLLITCLGVDVLAQSQVAAEPIVGLRDNRPRNYALIHARVISGPGQSTEDATLLIRDTSITAVGRDIEIPPGFMSINCSGRTIYPGLIDAWGEAEVPLPKTQTGYWNKNITPQRSAHSIATSAVKDAGKLRARHHRATGRAARWNRQGYQRDRSVGRWQRRPHAAETARLAAPTVDRSAGRLRWR